MQARRVVSRVENGSLPIQLPEDAGEAPMSEIARLAQAAREAHLASGGELMGPDEIAAEVRSRRGGVVDDATPQAPASLPLT